MCSHLTAVLTGSYASQCTLYPETTTSLYLIIPTVANYRYPLLPSKPITVSDVVRREMYKLFADTHIQHTHTNGGAGR